MALLHDKSDVCCKSELDLFTVPHTQMSIVKGPWVEYHPVSSITDEGPIEFNVFGTSEEYLDLSQTMLQVTVKVTNNDNTALPADAPVGPVNLFLPSLFAQVDIMLNEKLVSQPSNTYPYRAYIESLLHYGGETKESQLTQQLYYKDKAGKMDAVNPLASSAEANPGLAKRHGFIVERSMSINKDNLFHGQLPNRVVVGFVDTDAFNGTFGKNPFNFKHLRLNFISLTIDGETVPMRPLRPSFAAGAGQSYIHAYNSLFMGTNRLFVDKGININREEYCEGYTLFAFDLTPDLSDGCHLNLIKQGNLRLELQFDVAIPNTVNCIVYSEGQGLIQIDKSRNIIYDYQ
ncbi:uncharacterized protein F54H12.2-like [Diadema antillarum]|uniref:uncharacterized protein F54H12.2-like n=1 Tax=Diadema antillarum TaxID=105358 RepID=UPI003A8A1FC8